MTSFLANQVGGAFTPLVAKDKGDISNRGRCAGAQFVNNAKTLAADTVVIGGTAAAVYGVKKGGKFAKILAKPMDALANLYSKIAIKCRKNPKVFNGSKTVAKSIKNLPTKVKAVATLVYGVAIPALAYLTGRHLYRQGQIDQKYTDRAKVENHTKNIIDA